MSKGQPRYLYSKNLAKPQSKTLFEEDLKFMELLLQNNPNSINTKVIRNGEPGTEVVYFTLIKGCD